MTVNELIEALLKLPQNAEIVTDSGAEVLDVFYNKECDWVELEIQP